MTFGQRILQLRTEKGITQDELAIAVGYKSRSTIAKIESGERDPHQSMIVLLAKALDTTPAFLMGWDESEKNPQQFKNEDPEKDNKINGTPIKNDRSTVIERINALPDEQFEKFAERAEGYLDGLEDQLSHTPPKG